MTDEMRGGGGGRRQALRRQSMGNQPGHLIKESASSQLDLEYKRDLINEDTTASI